MIDALPKGLQRILIFEDFNEKYIALINQDTPMFHRVDPIRIAEPAVSAAFSHRSLGFEQVSVSFMVDARYFFEARQPLWTWSSLQSLTLTSRLLTRTEERWRISDLLKDAAEAAIHMPSLHTMAIWNGGNGEACGFIYRKQI